MGWIREAAELAVKTKHGPGRPHRLRDSGEQLNQSLNIAERNLESARGKQLSAAQVDLVSKIKGFLKDAREAAQGADWARARSLSKKAEVLSQELVAAR